MRCNDDTTRELSPCAPWVKVSNIATVAEWFFWFGFVFFFWFFFFFFVLFCFVFCFVLVFFVPGDSGF